MCIRDRGEGTEGLRKYARKRLVSMGVEEPTDEERAEIEEAKNAPQPPDPAMVLAEAEMKKAEADLVEAEVRQKTAEAEVKKKEAETVAIIAKLEQEERAQVMSAYQLLNQVRGEPETAPALTQPQTGGISGQ